MSLISKRVTRAAGAMALAALSTLAVMACSGGEEPIEGTSAEPDVPDDVAEVTAAINKNCWTTASTTVDGGFATTYTSAATYEDCFKGKVVQINDYSAEYAVGGHTQVRWAGARPSAANCVGSLMWVYLFEKRGDEWVFLKSKSAHGDLLTDDEPGDLEGLPSQPRPDLPVKPIKPGDIPPIIGEPITCRTPYVYFHSSDMVAGQTYRIAATARLPSGATQKISYKSTAGTCGHEEGDKCCWAGEACVNELECGADGTCESCGGSGEICCGNSCNDASLTCNDGQCTPCGGAAEMCCSDQRCDGGFDCVSGACKPCGKSGLACCTEGDACTSAGQTCQSGKCKNCGGANEACCPGSQCDDSSLTCQGAVCKPKMKPEPACGGPLGKCCAGNTCNSATTACVGGFCVNPDEPCSVVDDHCCNDKDFPYCKNTYYSRLTCKNNFCAL